MKIKQTVYFKENTEAKLKKIYGINKYLTKTSSKLSFYYE